jgi:two-component system, LytTR family, sensor kinase
MSLLRERGIRWSLLLALWTGPVLYWTVQAWIYSMRVGKPFDWGRIFSGELIYCYLWVGFTPLIFRLGRRFPIGHDRWRRNIWIHLAAGAGFAVMHRLISIAILRNFLPQYRNRPLSTQMMEMMAYDYGIGIYWITLSLGFAIDYYRRYRAEELRSAQLETQLAQAQLQALKTQLQPHFLFNTLNTISALVGEDPEAAERMIARLSELLRISLDNAGTQETSLRQELEFLQRYVDIESIRFEDRLEVSFDVPGETLDASVPNLILQPLVENAIRHGIAPRPAGGRVSIQSRKDEGRLVVTVSDNGCGRRGQVQEGVGIGSTRKRLERLYGKDHQFELKDLAEGGFEVVLGIPFRLAAATTDGEDSYTNRRRREAGAQTGSPAFAD